MQLGPVREMPADTKTQWEWFYCTKTFSCSCSCRLDTLMSSHLPNGKIEVSLTRDMEIDPPILILVEGFPES